MLLMISKIHFKILLKFATALRLAKRLQQILLKFATALQGRSGCKSLRQLDQSVANPVASSFYSRK